jgi:hypothetical protein
LEFWRLDSGEDDVTLNDQPDLVKCVKINRLKWPGLVMQMDNNRITRECLTLGQKRKEKRN